MGCSQIGLNHSHAIILFDHNTLIYGTNIFRGSAAIALPTRLRRVPVRFLERNC